MSTSNKHLSESELDGFRQKLKVNLQRTRETVSELSDQLQNSSNRQDYNQNYGDTGNRTQEAERVAELLEREKKYLTELEQALTRIENGTYGICEVTGDYISKKRLEAKPTATTTIEAARQ